MLPKLFHLLSTKCEHQSNLDSITRDIAKEYAKTNCFELFRGAMAEITKLQSSFLCILAVGMILLITVKFPHTFKYKSHHISINTLNNSIRNSQFEEASLPVDFQSYHSHSSNPKISSTETKTSSNNFGVNDDTLQDSTENKLLKQTNSQIHHQSKTYFLNNTNQISIDEFGKYLQF